MKRNQTIKIVPTFLTDMRGLGGGETSLLNLLAALCGNGLRPVFLCPEGDLYKEASCLDIDLYEMDYPDVHLKAGFLPTFSIPAVARIVRILLKHKPNVVHAESLLGLYYGGIAAFLTGIPLAATYHGYWPLRSRINRFLLKSICQRVYPVSKTMECELISFLGSNGDRIKTIPLGVSSEFLKSVPTQKEARSMLGLPPEKHIILQVARFQSIKGHHHLLNALARLVIEMRGNEPLALFVGGVLEPASTEILDYKRRIEQRASLPDLCRHVRLLGYQRDIPLFIRAADLVIVPSDFESFGMAVIEAMVIGTAVIATNSGGPAEIIENGKTGILVPPGDSSALAKAIRRMLENPGERENMAGSARSVALQYYRPTRRCDALLTEYSELIEK